jgi:putative membrane protein
MPQHPRLHRHGRLLGIGISSAALVSTAVMGVPQASASAHHAAHSSLNAQDRTYLHDSPQGDLLEIRGGRIARHKAHRQVVRQFGRRMIRDHSQEYREARQVGHTVGYAIPTSPSRGERRVLDIWRSTNPFAFPCAYITYEWEDHQLDIADAKDEIKDGHNHAVIADARQSLKVLRQHLRIATRILHHMRGC